ncbi:MAG: hypothetical protein DRJ34_00815 [Thermoprotei archaeon]|nr:MAG: hypothetical protein DRJ34_00815 [Thermoprotei archaeon]
MPTHKECMNYSNGRCMLYNVPMDPNGPACPQFRPKTITTQYPNKFLAQYPSANIQYSGDIQPRQGRRLRHRWRHRRGKRFFFF